MKKYHVSRQRTYCPEKVKFFKYCPNCGRNEEITDQEELDNAKRKYE